MANRGRPRKPKAQKIQEGTYRADRDYSGVVAKTINDVPKSPKYLSEIASEHFNNICLTLKEMNILTEADLLVVTQMAEALELHFWAYGYLKKGEAVSMSSTGFIGTTGYFSVWEKTGKTIRELANSLGLSPAARERIKIKPEEKQSDELTQILEG